MPDQESLRRSTRRSSGLDRIRRSRVDRARPVLTPRRLALSRCWFVMRDFYGKRVGETPGGLRRQCPNIDRTRRCRYFKAGVPPNFTKRIQYFTIKSICYKFEEEHLMP